MESWEHKSARYRREAEKTQRETDLPSTFDPSRMSPPQGSWTNGSPPQGYVAQFPPPPGPLEYNSDPRPLSNPRTNSDTIRAPSSSARDVGIFRSLYGDVGNTRGDRIPPPQIIAGQNVWQLLKPPKLTTLTAVEKDPYQHIEFLGSGAYGWVDTVRKVVNPGAVFARKTIKITTGRNRDTQLKAVESEFEILRRLRHHHVVKVLELYSCKNKLSIIMSVVAECDLKEYLEKLDGLSIGPDRHAMMKPLLMWQGCLIQAIDYLHEMKIKHKDIKPANILVQGGNVIITDFGIAKDVIDEETTASLITSMQGSPMYMAPEIESGRRGRAVDIFSLGCVFLEISTCMIAGPGSRAQFAEHRNINGSRAYSKCPTRILQWLWYLWGRWAEYNVFKTRSPDWPMDHMFVNQSILPGELAFMMLDPNPKTRITSRQLVQKIHGRSNLWDDIKMKACPDCNTGSLLDDDNIPQHSTFKEDRDLRFPRPPDIALASQFYLDWEDAKRLFLASHMWW